MQDLVEALIAFRDLNRNQMSRGQMALIAEAANEIKRLRKIEAAAAALRFSAYPAHGSGFVMQVSGGNIDDLKMALGHEGTEMVMPSLSGAR